LSEEREGSADDKREGSICDSSPAERPARPPRSRWTSFVADRDDPTPRTLHEQGNPAHRARVEYNRHTILIHLSGEDGSGWTVLAVDRGTRRWAVGQARRQLDAAEAAVGRLYEDGPS
jgi:cytolysin (calcineurin-like family phosphatase)